jgi:hypothetical protein
MTKLAIAIGALAITIAAAAPASADFAVIKFKDNGACRTWYGPKDKPWGKTQVLWVKTSSAAEAQKKGAWAMKHHWCKAWW